MCRFNLTASQQTKSLISSHLISLKYPVMSWKEADVRWQLFLWLTHQNYCTHVNELVNAAGTLQTQRKSAGVSEEGDSTQQCTVPQHEPYFGFGALTVSSERFGKERRTKTRSSSRIGWQITPCRKTTNGRTRAVKLVSSPNAQTNMPSAYAQLTPNMQTIGQGKFGSLSPHNAVGQAWAQMGVVRLLQICAPFFCSLCSFLPLSERLSGRKEKFQLLL